MKTNSKIILGIIIAVLLSTVSCYVLAENLINSKDVVYKDNSNLVADNVQEAIDGTCTKIDTRLSNIEDKLYTVKNMYYKGPSFTSSTSPIYVGVSITLPAKSYCGILVTSVHSTGAPKDVFLSTSQNELLLISDGYSSSNENLGNNTLFIPFNEYVTTETTYYVWASHNTVGTGRIEIKGFCATKYK